MKESTSDNSKKKPSLFHFIWLIMLRGFLCLAGVIFILYGLDGVIGGSILPAAGRGGHYPSSPSGSPVSLTGLTAVMYGSFFVLLGLAMLGFASGLLPRLISLFKR